MQSEALEEAALRMVHEGTGIAHEPGHLEQLGAYGHLRAIAYSDNADHQFRQADHRFRSMPITLEERRSIAALGGRVTELKFRGWSGSSSSDGAFSGVLRGQPRAGFPEG